MTGSLLFGCARVELGALRFDGLDGFRVEPDSGPVIALAPRIGIELPLNAHVTARGYFDAAIAFNPSTLWRKRTTPAGSDRILWASPPVSPLIGAGLATTF